MAFRDDQGKEQCLLKRAEEHEEQQRYRKTKSRKAADHSTSSVEESPEAKQAVERVRYQEDCEFQLTSNQARHYQEDTEFNLANKCEQGNV